MRHRIKKRSFNRSTKHRKALLKNLVLGLLEHGEIEITKERAKEVKRLVDKLMPFALENTLESKRRLHEFFGRRDVVNTLCEVIAPAMNDRKSGFTTLEVTGNRKGDNALMARLSLVNKPAELNGFRKIDQQAEEN